MTRFYILKIAAIAAIILVASAGCGRKGDIIPPGTVIPNQVRDLRAEATGGTVVLAWTAPSTNTDESQLTDLDGFDILRTELPEGGGECDCRYEAVATLYIGAPGDAVVTGRRVAWSDRTGASSFGSRYGYMVRPFNTGGYRGPDSNTASVALLAPPPEPEGLTATPGDGTVSLSWMPVTYGQAPLAGYNVYRIEKEGAPVKRPLNREPVKDTDFVDTGLENGKELHYRVSALAGEAAPYSEGAMSPVVTAVPADRIPPETPDGLQAVPMEGGVLVSWLPSTDTDTAGYILYRKGPGENSPRPLPGMPTIRITYVDNGVEPGGSYEYSVSAVDNASPANESRLSGAVSVTMPRHDTTDG